MRNNKMHKTVYAVIQKVHVKIGGRGGGNSTFNATIGVIVGPRDKYLITMWSCKGSKRYSCGVGMVFFKNVADWHMGGGVA
jgi:hypothetical protein